MSNCRLFASQVAAAVVDDYGGKVASVNIVAILYYYVCPCSAFGPVSKSSTSKDHAGLPCRGSVVKDADNLPLCFALVLYTDISPATRSVLVVVYQQELLVTAKLFFDWHRLRTLGKFALARVTRNTKAKGQVQAVVKHRPMNCYRLNLGYKITT